MNVQLKNGQAAAILYKQIQNVINRRYYPDCSGRDVLKTFIKALLSVNKDKTIIIILKIELLDLVDVADWYIFVGQITIKNLSHHIAEE